MNRQLSGENATFMDRLKAAVNSFGLPRLIIACFLLLLFIAAPFVGADFATQITNTINRFSWNAILVLAMVPMIHSGCGLNFGLPLGIISGLLGATLSIEFGWLLNKIKGGEMMIATYVGFSSVSFMCMMGLLLPYKSPTMVWGFAGKGLRTTISLEGFYDKVLANFLQINIGNLSIPTGTLLFFALLAFLMWAFLHTKTGTAMTAVYMALPAVSAILIGGASVNKASIANVIIGTFLFQGIVTMTPTVMNSMIHMDMSEVIRIIISNGMILYALTRKTEGSK